MKSILWDKPKVNVYVDLSNGNIATGIEIPVDAETIAKLVSVYIFNFVSSTGVKTCSEYEVTYSDGVPTVNVYCTGGTYTITGNTITYSETVVPSDVVEVTVTEDELDKTYAEIKEAFEAGKSVFYTVEAPGDPSGTIIYKYEALSLVEDTNAYNVIFYNTADATAYNTYTATSEDGKPVKVIT